MLSGERSESDGAAGYMNQLERVVKKYINDFGKECYKEVEPHNVFSDFDFHTPSHKFESNKQVALHTNLGSLTVLDRLTGFSGGIRDIESGFRDSDGSFWLASGGYDVRESNAITIADAIQWVKEKANTCVPA